MKRMLLTAALLLYAMLTLTGCCASLCGVPCQMCGLLSSLPGVLLVQSPDQADTALVSTQTPAYVEPATTCDADNPMPF